LFHTCTACTASVKSFALLFTPKNVKIPQKYGLGRYDDQVSSYSEGALRRMGSRRSSTKLCKYLSAAHQPRMAMSPPSTYREAGKLPLSLRDLKHLWLCSAGTCPSATAWTAKIIDNFVLLQFWEARGCGDTFGEHCARPKPQLTNTPKWPALRRK